MNRTAQRVLIIEDNRNLAIGLSNNLEVEGYSATIANDGAAGLECVRNWLPEIGRASCRERV